MPGKLRAAVLWFAVVATINTVNALSVLTERARQGPPVDSWEPFVWEYSSGFAVLVLLPAIVWLERRFPFSNDRLISSLFVHLAATVPFSLLHVAVMVGIRKLVYRFADRHYEFGNLPTELLYEFRKDVITYFLILGVLYAWRRLRGPRTAAAGAADSDTEFAIRHRGHTVRVAARDIDWIEAAGNYVVLHVGEMTYTYRETMKGMASRLGDGFCRIHRSILVNLDRIDVPRTAQRGAQYVRLKDGTELGSGDAYRDAILSQLGEVTNDTLKNETEALRRP